MLYVYVLKKGVVLGLYLTNYHYIDKIIFELYSNHIQVSFLTNN